MQKNSSIYYSKILLFGEYSVIYNSMGLSIPYSHFRGEFDFIGNDKYTDLNFAHESNRLLRNFADHVRKMIQNNELAVPFNYHSFVKDLEKGLFFESTIPQGFGLGSSGALVAALYDRYVEDRVKNIKKITRQNIFKLKETFASLESFFHGTSSGLDPLNSYLKVPLLINNKEDIKIIDLPEDKNLKDGAIFLIDSGFPRKTGPLVNYFLNRANDEPSFLQSIHEQFIPTTNACINNLLSGEMDTFYNNLYKLSQYQFQFLQRMIPGDFLPVWEDGLSRNEYNLKLCGSGGGGFILGFTKDYLNTQEILARKNIELIPVFKAS
jgi:mevalonate kinase